MPESFVLALKRWGSGQGQIIQSTSIFSFLLVFYIGVHDIVKRCIIQYPAWSLVRSCLVSMADGIGSCEQSYQWVEMDGWEIWISFHKLPVCRYVFGVGSLTWVRWPESCLLGLTVRYPESCNWRIIMMSLLLQFHHMPWLKPFASGIRDIALYRGNCLLIDRETQKTRQYSASWTLYPRTINSRIQS